MAVSTFLIENRFYISVEGIEGFFRGSTGKEKGKMEESGYY